MFSRSFLLKCRPTIHWEYLLSQQKSSNAVWRGKGLIFGCDTFTHVRLYFNPNIDRFHAIGFLSFNLCLEWFQSVKSRRMRNLAYLWPHTSLTIHLQRVERQDTLWQTKPIRDWQWRLNVAIISYSGYLPFIRFWSRERHNDFRYNHLLSKYLISRSCEIQESRAQIKLYSSIKLHHARTPTMLSIATTKSRFRRAWSL